MLGAAGAAVAANVAQNTAEINRLRREISDLRTARGQIETARRETRDLRNGVRARRNPDNRWRGTRRLEYESDVEDFIRDYGAYDRQVGAIISSINSEITRRQLRIAALQATIIF